MGDDIYMIKKNYRRLVLLGLLFIMVLSSVACANKEEGMVAMVDGEGISIHELEKKFDLVGIKETTELQFGEGALEQEVEEGITLERKLKEELLEQLVMVKIIAKNAEKTVKITDEMLAEQKTQYIEDVGGKEKFAQFLIEKEITEEELEEYMKEDLLVKTFQQNIMDEMKVTDEDAKKYFEENKDDIITIRLEHILLKEKSEAEAVLKKIKEGADFAQLAISAENGGDIGYITKNSPLIEEYKNIGFNLEVGQVSDIVESELGYSIIRLTDRKEDFEFFEEDIINNIKMEALSKKIEEMKEKANYKMIPENLIIESKEDKKDKDSEKEKNNDKKESREDKKEKE